MEFDLLKLELDGAVATLTFNDPDNLNAMSEPMLASLDKALDVIEDPQNTVRCLIMTGAGRGFCAGANVARMDGNGADDAARKSNTKQDAGAGLERVYHPLLRRLRNLHCPIVSAVNGPCAGVGMSFALMGDMIFAGKSAFFLQAFRRIGLVPDGGATYLLPRIIGMARARELAIMGERLPAETALEWGLINRVSEDDALMDDAKSLAQESDLTAAGDIMGTPGYMAPEQAQGHSDRVTPAADVYGLGAVLYRILTGQAPIESRGGDFAETMQLVREHDVIPPRARNRHVPMEMDAVCMKALETEPASRYQHARDFADDLQRCLVGETTEARQTSIVRRVHRWARHRPGLAATIAVVLLFYSYHLVALATGLLVAGDLFQQTVNLIVPLALLNAFLWQWALKKTSGASWTLYAWSTGEILMVTVVIANGDGASSGLISTLFVLVAVSTLRCRRMLVAYVTALCLLSYVYLWITSLEGPMTAPDILQAVPRILNLLLIGLIQYLSVIRSSVSFEASGGQRQIADTGDRNAG